MKDLRATYLIGSSVLVACSVIGWGVFALTVGAILWGALGL